MIIAAIEKLGDFLLFCTFHNNFQPLSVLFLDILGLISQTDLSLASNHFVLDLSPKAFLSPFVKFAPD